jgi:hypothetical protein
MQADNRKRNKKKLITLFGFIAVFGSLIFFGYNNFVKQDAVTIKDSTGLNNKLPAAEALKPLNKLEIYMQAEKDSLVRKQERDNDPNTKNFQTGVAREGIATSTNPKANTFSLKSYSSKRSPLSPLKPETKNPQEDEIEKKMRQLNKILNGSNDIVEPKTSNTNNSPPLGGWGVDSKKPEATTSVDPDLQKLDGMLDKLMNIQHPENTINTTTGPSKPAKPVLPANKVSNVIPNQTIQAVVHNTQTIMNGSTIKLRLLNDILVNDTRISKGSFLFGISVISNERLIVQLTNINHLNTVIPVSLSVFDIDGIEGIYIPGAVEREVSKEGADQAINSFNLSSYNPTVSGQLTSAGIQATKSLLSKRARMIRVTVKAGHHILLQNTEGH